MSSVHQLRFGGSRLRISQVTSSLRKSQLPVSPRVGGSRGRRAQGGPQHPDGLSVSHADVEGKFAATTGRDAKEINHRYPRPTDSSLSLCNHRACGEGLLSH